MKILEVDLYEPVHRYFKRLGYKVHGEVHHCDVAAVKDENLIIVELKLFLNIDLLIQATKRQRLTDMVYIAIPRPKFSLRTKKWKDICYLIRRLELGLIIVSFQKSGAYAEVKIDPSPFDRNKSMQVSRKKRENIVKEIEGRHGDYNVGGSNQTKIMTAYKENCIHIACCLACFGILSPRRLRELGTGDKTLSILHKNYYGWFERVKRGTYIISEKGKTELKLYPEIVEHYNRKIFETSNLI
ncbi:DUF2161 domain-containing phosphodiesterase [Lederbergia panacisoli]|uniref:DUF2161 domain-containing phosphodiesterase n=1 Tax=Lederbergia panacisoli TaxID=1255251 RepID=UPI00214CE40E|nr:DUF2161 family putative PD-(D/E)XK-type phosphodiesterase [Lederbergia panacisoli]MCR2822198.1 DUF2161 family putative PD-(D/E)XK-type phosphodiesterase [Lederbergia panacisoli]